MLSSRTYADPHPIIGSLQHLKGAMTRYCNSASDGRARARAWTAQLEQPCIGMSTARFSLVNSSSVNSYFRIMRIGSDTRRSRTYFNRKRISLIRTAATCPVSLQLSLGTKMPASSSTAIRTQDGKTIEASQVRWPVLSPELTTI